MAKNIEARPSVVAVAAQNESYFPVPRRQPSDAVEDRPLSIPPPSLQTPRPSLPSFTHSGSMPKFDWSPDGIGTFLSFWPGRGGPRTLVESHIW